MSNIKKKSLSKSLKKISFEHIVNSEFFIGLAKKSKNVFWIRSTEYQTQLYVSPAYEIIWGRSCQSLYDAPDEWINFLHPDDKKRFENELSQRNENVSMQERYEIEYRIIRPDGEIRWIKDSAFPIYNTQKTFIGFAGIAEDITKDKYYEQSLIAAKEKAEAANNAKTEFLQNMRHDMRTPLSGIMGFAHLIKEEAQNSRMEEYADNMFASSKALLDFVNEILETINITSGDLPLLKKKFDVYQKIESIISLLKAKANAKNITLTLNVDKKLPQYLVGDYKRLSRIALEILANALNFTHEGTVDVSLELAEKKEFMVVLKLTVKDTGIGMPADRQEDIFLRFKRLTPSYEGIYKGAGLGLTITKQFIDELNGEILVESTINKGSTFTVLIPMNVALLYDDSGIDKTPDTMIFSRLDSISISKNESKIKLENSSEKLQISSQILIVEDDHIAAVSTKQMLQKLSCNVDIASTGKSGVEYAQKNHYDLIFMDIGLPDMKGHDVTREIRAWEAGHEDKHTPIIALTAHISTEEKQGFIEAGMDAALSKPLLKETATDILKTFIPGRSAKKYHLKQENKEKETPPKENNLFNLKGEILAYEDTLKKYGDEETVKELFGLLQKSFDEEIPDLKKAQKENDWDAIKRISHKFRGSASYCGTERFQQSCANLENYLKTGENELREKLLAQLLKEVESVKEALMKIK
jgi:two-component system aerobic respiration control sensor histidine kinase ArcB